MAEKGLAFLYFPGRGVRLPQANVVITVVSLPCGAVLSINVHFYLFPLFYFGTPTSGSSLSHWPFFRGL